jgi:hypothetical protein
MALPPMAIKWTLGADISETVSGKRDENNTEILPVHFYQGSFANELST